MYRMQSQVCVAVATFRRPLDLAALLPLLQAQLAGLPARFAGHVLIVDNDPAAGAHDVVAEVADPSVRYVHEPVAGIAAARNRALTTAADYDVLVFIDDDERPADGWLLRLLERWESSGAQAVAGPVVTVPPDDLDPWIGEGGFLDRRHRAGTASGAELTDAASNNLLVDLTFARRHDLAFDVDFGLTGGEDTLFTRSLIGSGGRIVWERDALVTEQIRPERLTRRWFRFRALSYGSTDARIGLALAQGRIGRLRTRLRATAGGVARLLYGTALAAVGAARRDIGRRAWGEQLAWRGFGLLVGLTGRSHLRYRRDASPVATGRAGARRPSARDQPAGLAGSADRGAGTPR